MRIGLETGHQVNKVQGLMDIRLSTASIAQHTNSVHSCVENLRLFGNMWFCSMGT